MPTVAPGGSAPISSSSSVVNHGTVASTGTAMIVGRQNGTIVFSSLLSVTDALGGHATRYVSRVVNKSKLVPGLVTWTVYLTTAGDVDGPGRDVAVATTRLVSEDDLHDLRDLRHRPL